MTTTSVEFHDTKDSLSQTLINIADGLPEGNISVRDLLAQIGEQSMLLFSIILTIPFLTPIPLPGISTVFGLLIMLIGFGVILNRLPWLPRQLLDRSINSSQLSQVLTKGSQLFVKIERFIKPRMLSLTSTGSTNRLNGFVLFAAGSLLILPLPMLPFSNFLPGWAILFLVAGMLQRDGVFVLIGYLLVVITFVYFTIIAIGIVAAGQSIFTIFQDAPDPAVILPFFWR